MKSTKKTDSPSFEQNKFVILSFIILIVIAVTIRLVSTKEEKNQPVSPRERADTLIPDGHVLVPLELSNQDHIQSVLERFGFVDLFVGKPGQTGAKKLLRKVKILKTDAQLNTYMALVTENTAEIILRNPGPYWAVIQNPKAEKKQAMEKKTNLIRIEYYKGG